MAFKTIHFLVNLHGNRFTAKNLHGNQPTFSLNKRRPPPTQKTIAIKALNFALTTEQAAQANAITKILANKATHFRLKISKIELKMAKIASLYRIIDKKRP